VALVSANTKRPAPLAVTNSRAMFSATGALVRHRLTDQRHSESHHDGRSEALCRPSGDQQPERGRDAAQERGRREHRKTANRHAQFSLAGLHAAVHGVLALAPSAGCRSRASLAARVCPGRLRGATHQFVDTRKKCRTQRPSVPRSHSPSESPVAAFLQRVPMALGGSGGRYPGALAELLGEPDNDALRPADIG
jgi:hypothetical protein